MAWAVPEGWTWDDDGRPIRRDELAIRRQIEREMGVPWREIAEAARRWDEYVRSH